jgi:sialic acid synthase SpsE/spore coat polysaccharide biosynthesis protein SpsF (cytidylyltransferase family)
MKIIAESASNHNGNLDYMLKLAQVSKDSGADYFTFQILDPTSFCAADYERFEIVNEIALSRKDWGKLLDYCEELQLPVIPCPLDLTSFHFCLSRNLELIKIHATDIVNVPFLKEIQKNPEVKVLLETQCATYQDIKLALRFIENQLEAIIHGFSNYPTEVEDLNLNALDAIADEFGHKIGLADHSIDSTEIPLMALAKGATYLEKHITVSRNDRHYDWQVSLYPDEFASMVNKVAHYTKALGKRVKHPPKVESDFRGVLFKKVLNHDLSAEMKRADYGNDYLTELFNSFSKNRIGVGIIARLKSKRLKKKVLKPFHSGTMIQDLYHRIGKSELTTDVAVITSFIAEDDPLANFCEQEGLNVFRGHPTSVIDRMLSFAMQNHLGLICRVTGDNPFSDPEILDQMIKLMNEESLDYIKVNNAPIGVGVELYSVSYLWQLYLRMENPFTSEYLAWIALNDEESAKGCIDIIHKNENLSYYNLSVDYQEDYDRCMKVLSHIEKEDFKEIGLSDVLNAMDIIEASDKQMEIKLPQGKSTTFEGFNQLIDEVDYKRRVNFELS